jgi:phosphate transport system protein
MMSDADPLEWLEEQRRGQDGPRVEFHQQLEACHTTLVDVAGVVADAIDPVTTAFLHADTHAAREFVQANQLVSARCLELEEACYLLLARQSPVAVDLRRIVATLRSAMDVERSGHLLRHVAESLTWVHPPSMPSDLVDTIRQLGTGAAAVFAGGLAAWQEHDALAAVELTRRDEEVDLLQKVLLSEIYTGRQSVEESVTLALIARYFERIADHGVELARQVTFFLTGERLSKGPLDDL